MNKQIIHKSPTQTVYADGSIEKQSNWEVDISYLIIHSRNIETDLINYIEANFIEKEEIRWKIKKLPLYNFLKIGEKFGGLIRKDDVLDILQELK